MQMDRRHVYSFAGVASEVHAERSSLELLREPIQRTYARHEEILTTAKHVEGLDAADEPSDRFFGNGEGRAFFLQADDRVTFVTDANEVAVVNPFLLQEF